MSTSMPCFGFGSIHAVYDERTTVETPGERAQTLAMDCYPRTVSTFRRAVSGHVCAIYSVLGPPLSVTYPRLFAGPNMEYVHCVQVRAKEPGKKMVSKS